MKKILIIAAVAGLTMASCKKERTCTCTLTPTSETDNGVTQTIDPTPYTLSNKLTKVSKNGAHCNSGTETDTQTQINGGTSHTIIDTYKVDCTLK